MDFKYKHFHQQRLYPVARVEVSDSARAVMTQSVGWTVTNEASGGFVAQGSSFGHAGIANIQIRSVSGGTSVDVELRVERAGFSGFMLFDVGGYYDIQIRKWLDAIQASSPTRNDRASDARHSAFTVTKQDRRSHLSWLPLADRDRIWIVFARHGYRSSDRPYDWKSASGWQKWHANRAWARRSYTLGGDSLVRRVDCVARNEEATSTIDDTLACLRGADCAILQPGELELVLCVSVVEMSRDAETLRVEISSLTY